MKRKILIFIFAAIFIWGVYKVFTKTEDDMKNVGDVTIVCNDVISEIKGNKLLKQYEDKITNFDCPSLDEISSTLISVKKPENVSGENSESDFYVKYKGEFINRKEDHISYNVYDSEYKFLYKTDTLSIQFDDGSEYYIGMDVKWGKPKNYICMRYYFKITT